MSRRLLLLVVVFTLSPETGLLAWTGEEHRSIAREAAGMAWEVGGAVTGREYRDILPLWVARFVGDDDRAARYQFPGRSRADCLAGLSPGRVDRLVNRAKRRLDRDDRSLQTPNALRFSVNTDRGRGAVFHYLLYHEAALRLARESDVYRSLIVESIAQGFLADAFSGSHLLVPVKDLLFSLHRANRREAHNHYGRQGVYVINERGEIWQAFGDGLLDWYPICRDRVVEAAALSIEEVVARVEPGREFKESPVVQLIPEVVSRTWSVATDSLDTLGLTVRRHIPRIGQARPRDATAVEFYQNRRFPPSSKGIFLFSGAALTSRDGDRFAGALYGAGYGFFKGLSGIGRLEGGFSILPDAFGSGHTLLSPYLSSTGELPSIELPGILFRSEIGYSWWPARSPGEGGMRFATGFVFPTIRLPATYAGLSPRLLYEFLDLTPTSHSIVLGIAIQ